MNRMTIRELECFTAIADHLNFSRAARQLNLSQPPLTRHLQSLEEKVGARLFERNTHAVSLTAAGRLLLEDARAILRQLDQATETVRRAGQGETARLRLALIGALLDEKLVRLIRQFRERQPACQVQIVDLAPAPQLEAIIAGELDGGFIGAKPAQKIKGLDFLVWSREPLVLALPERHELSKMRGLTWEHLKKLNWVLVSLQAATAFRQQFAQLEKSHGLACRIVGESDRVAAVLTMVAAGNGVSMVPQSIERLISKGVVFRKLPLPEPSLEHAFAYPAKKVSPALEEFLKLLGKKDND